MRKKATEVFHVVKNAVKPRQFSVLLGKLRAKLFERMSDEDRTYNSSWLKKVGGDFESTAKQLDAPLWDESLAFAADLEERAQKKSDELGQLIGGGGHYAMLYFMTRYHKPETAVETGVAAGFSSQAILAAMHRNGKGTLYSSEFPNPRLRRSEQHIGAMVEEHLKDRWETYLDGDRRNLPRIASKVGKVDLFHYDSDKRRSGRQFAMDTMTPLFHDGTITIMDDIDDDLFFHDYVQETECSWSAFELEGPFVGRKFIGMVTL